MSQEYNAAEFVCLECSGERTVQGWDRHGFSNHTPCSSCNGSGLNIGALLVAILQSNLRIEQLLTNKS